MRFYVDDYKWAKQTGDDDGVPLRMAIAQAVASGKPSEVILGAGSYYVAPKIGDGDFEVGSLFIRDAANITLRGAGQATKLIFTNPLAGGVAFERCRNVRIADLQIDWDPQPYAFGHICQVDAQADTYDLELDEASMDFNHEAFRKARLQFAMTVKRDDVYGVTRYGPGVIQNVKLTSLGGRRWRVSKLSDVPEWFRATLTVGSGYVHLARSFSGSGVCFSQCRDAVAERVTILSSPALAFYPTNNEGRIRYNSCRVRPAEGRLLSTNADGVHAPGNRGELIVENCSFEGMADDAINMRGTTLMVSKVLSPSEVLVTRLNYPMLPGMKLVIYDGVSLKERARVTVKSAAPTAEQTRIEFDQAVEGMKGGSSFADADRIYNLPTVPAPFVVRNCRFLAFRGRGILASSVGGVIENNLYENNEGWGIDLGFGERVWGEGPAPQNLLIAGNRFVGRGGYLASITARVSAAEAIDADENRGRLLMRNITIRSNRFINLTAPAIQLRGVDGVKLDNNTVTGDGSRSRGAHSFFAGVASAVDIDSCQNVEVTKLDVEDRLFRYDMRIGALVPGGTKGCSISAGSLRVKDERTSAWPVTMGAIRWDAWFTDPYNPYADNLADKRWHNRLPFYAKLSADGRPLIYGDTQQVVDKEIAYAKHGSIDYFIYPFQYPDVRDDGFRHDKMNNALNLYLKSKHNADVHFCMLVSPGHEYLLHKTDPRDPNCKRIDELIALMKHPSYQKVCGERPIIYLMFWNPGEQLGGGSQVSFFVTKENGRGWLDALRARVQQAGLPNPYLVVLAQSPTGAAAIAADGGLDAISAYTSWGGTDYASMCAAQVKFWDAMKATGAKVIPNLNAGWGGPRDGSGDKLQPKPGEIGAHLSSALSWIDQHPQATEAKTLIWYAWNEIDEGGWLVPDMGRGAEKLNETGKAMRSYRNR